ncbi:hypothetical protein NPIL_523581 [Nephila pilipes]|uniref:Uncharacterized protein n=1 Tax=Nephila pilipes TaxID=299642 RepID=A0A8X6PIP4_NEPPI|nr:hypothetical protein NPIL_523581 [Nephila pilipes]
MSHDPVGQRTKLVTRGPEYCEPTSEISFLSAILAVTESDPIRIKAQVFRTQIGSHLPKSSRASISSLTSTRSADRKAPLFQSAHMERSLALREECFSDFTHTYHENKHRSSSTTHITSDLTDILD